jgi:hypothetical protein
MLNSKTETRATTDLVTTDYELLKGEIAEVEGSNGSFRLSKIYS